MKATLKEMPVAGPVLKKIVSTYRSAKDRIGAFHSYLKNKHLLSSNGTSAKSGTGRRVFILATGPSIKTQDLSLLVGELCISVSNFFVHPDFQKIKPRYHVFAPSHDPIPDSQIVIWFKDAEKHFPDGQEVFLSLHDKVLVDSNGLFKKQKVNYYQIDYRHTGAIRDIDFTKRIPAIQTVNHLGIYLGLYLDAKELYLLGCDHNWILNLGKSSHFYEEKQNALVREGYDEMKNRNMENEFRAYLNLWSLYKNIRSYAHKLGVEIWNATPGSLLDVFPRANLKDVYGKN